MPILDKNSRTESGTLLAMSATRESKALFLRSGGACEIVASSKACWQLGKVECMQAICYSQLPFAVDFDKFREDAQVSSSGTGGAIG